MSELTNKEFSRTTFVKGGGALVVGFGLAGLGRPGGAGAAVPTPAGYLPDKTQAKPGALHPLQQAWIDVQVPHCGYCQNGMMIQAADLLAKVKKPTEAQIRTAMNGHLCRCGTYPRILTAIQRAAKTMAKGSA